VARFATASASLLVSVWLLIQTIVYGSTEGSTNQKRPAKTQASISRPCVAEFAGLQVPLPLSTTAGGPSGKRATVNISPTTSVRSTSTKLGRL
jgi:hypothetical protein